MYDTPRLLADIGSTYARFTLESAPGIFDHAAMLPCAEQADFVAAVRSYLRTLPTDRILHAAVAIANPVEGDHVRMTNYHWQFSIEAARRELGFDTLVVVNDFTALAMSLPRLSPRGRRQVGGGHARPRAVIGLLGSGSGLGVSGLIPTEEGWISLGSEGGHTSFSPRDDRELAILEHARTIYPHVSFERLLSGSGLELMHQALVRRAGLAPVAPLPAREITRLGLAGSDGVCVQTLEAFCAMLGTAAGNLAVTLGALGGIHIGGTIVPRLGEYFDRSGFRARFEDRGRFSAYLAGIPTYVVTEERATFMGVAAILEAELARLGKAGASAILEQVRRVQQDLSPAERRVAEHVLKQPRTVLNAPVADIARAADVSQPTVIRFCRSLGCDGLSDFKLRLASGLTGTVPLQHSQVTNDDSSLELGAKVLGNTAAAILQVRDHLNREAIEQAIDQLAGAGRVELYAVGQSAVVAHDAQLKFLRFGIPTSACTDPRIQPLAANVLRPGDVVLVVSSGGKLPGLLEVADTARRRGARVIAITASGSPLARKADVALIADHVEDAGSHLPMISRILHLLLIDILAVGLAMRRSGRTDAAALPLPPELDEPADANGPRGASQPLSMALITTHGR
jgi:glucokinase